MLFNFSFLAKGGKKNKVFFYAKKVIIKFYLDTLHRMHAVQSLLLTIIISEE